MVRLRHCITTFTCGAILGLASTAKASIVSSDISIALEAREKTILPEESVTFDLLISNVSAGEIDWDVNFQILSYGASPRVGGSYITHYNTFFGNRLSSGSLSIGETVRTPFITVDTTEIIPIGSTITFANILVTFENIPAARPNNYTAFDFQKTLYDPMPTTHVIPEPSSVALFLLGTGAVLLRRNKMSNQRIHSIAGSARSE